MRLQAYLDAVAEAEKLPTSVSDYFKSLHNPQQAALCKIVKTARLDVDALYDRELAEIIVKVVEIITKANADH